MPSAKCRAAARKGKGQKGKVQNNRRASRVASTGPLLPAPCLTAWGAGDSVSGMLRQVLKSKLYRAMTTDSVVDYEGSIEIPRDLMEAADLWEGEKVLVASIDTTARLETYVLAGEPGTGRILINGGAANRIKKGERLTIMAFALSEVPVTAVKLVLDEHNRIVRRGN